jgi:hypothetical protein
MTQTKITKVKPGINPRGYRRAVKDYTEPAVIEELAANSYDADASTVLVLLDPDKQELHIIDDGTGFTKHAILSSGILGGGEKHDVEYSLGKRPYLGAYGFGLKATVNIARKVRIQTVSIEGQFDIDLDWSSLEEALRPDFGGFDLQESPRKKGQATGTHITLSLTSPTSEEFLESYASVLGNLPLDNGKFKCYVGLASKLRTSVAPALQDFAKLRPITRKLASKHSVFLSEPSTSADLDQCQVIEGGDRQDSSVTYKIYFTGIEDGKVLPLKPGLRGIFVRIHGRLLKHSFTDQKYVYPISKWVMFASGLRVELSIDWLRNEISLSRDDLKFANSKLEEQFIAVVGRVVSAFIQPQLKKLERKAAQVAAKLQNQRMELAKKRTDRKGGGRVPSITSGFNFIPETDGELALLLSNDEVLQKLNPSYILIDYNDKVAYDCILFDKARREFVHAELEPTLMEFLQHKNIPPELTLIITWSLGKWRIGAKKRGKGAYLQLIADTGARPGHFRLLSFPRQNSKKPSTAFNVIALELMLKK